jgi:hypothetical protein
MHVNLAFLFRSSTEVYLPSNMMEVKPIKIKDAI